MLNAYDLKEFYNTKTGLFVKKTLSQQIASIWPEVKDNKLIGAGYAYPYLENFEDAERVLALSPTGLGLYRWPDRISAKNKTALCDFTAFPFEDDSIERCLMVHALEFLEHPKDSLAEVWRILKPNGRLILIVPNRSGLWARSDATPFGQGRPYSLSQVRSILKEESFVIERLMPVLYTPPFRSNLMIKSFEWMERIGQFLPLFSGAYVIEASKQIYATKGVPVRQQRELEKKIRLQGVNPQPG